MTTLGWSWGRGNRVALYNAVVELEARDAAASAEGWDDLRVSVVAAAKKSDAPTLTTFRGNVEAFAFSASASNFVYFDAQLPHAWIEGSEIRPHIHWSPGNSTNTGSVRWQLEYTWSNPVNAPGNVFPAPTTATAVDQAASGTAYAHQIADLGAIDGTGMRVSSVLMCRLARLGGATEDTFTGVAFGLSVDFHIQVAGNGSADEYPEPPA